MDQHANTTQSTDPKSTSSFTTTTITNSTGIGNENDFQSNQATIIKILQDELQRKREELNDVHRAYTFLTTQWSCTKYREGSIHLHCYAVQQAWVRSEKPHPWGYREQLEDAAKRLEEEISEIRGGLKDIAVAIAGGRKDLKGFLLEVLSTRTIRTALLQEEPTEEEIKQAPLW
ncbi:MAG: hypothetical protein J3R72DRAFT_526601 [Linnemannia gamsii]|nr:MAG: hypothetical protein J3R72DRAFT_526601 [Linnemannia gamsii]